MPYDETLILFDSTWENWAHVDPLTIGEASSLLAGGTPNVLVNNAIRAKSDAYRIALLRAIETGSLVAHRALARYAGSREFAEPCEHSDPDLCDDTLVRRLELCRWADEHGIVHGWKPERLPESTRNVFDPARFPEELRAAIEAFDAVRNNPAATRGKRPKTALLDWLLQNRPKLSKNARERIASVSNWEPEGGAPKTPG